MTDIAGIGHNGPPPDQLTPFQTVEKLINDLFSEAIHHLDGDPISTDGQAEDVAALLNLIRDAERKADEARKAENEPFDKGKAEVQARYAPLIADTKTVKGKTVLAAEACKKALAPWLQKKEAERIEAARLAQIEADKKAEEARMLMQLTEPTDLAGRAAAEDVAAEAKKADHAAGKLASATSKIGNMAGRAISLRKAYTHELTDPIAFGKYVWANHRPEYLEFLNTMAKRLVDGGKHNLDGVKVTEDRRVA